MPARRNRLKRGLFWTGVTFLLLVLYAASFPFVPYWSQRHLRTALPIIEAFYAPLVVYSRSDWLGKKAYIDYQLWSYRILDEHGRGDARFRLDDQTSLRFAGTPLRDVVSYLSEVHDCYIELQKEVDGDAIVTIVSQATLREALDELLRPLGLAAAPVGRKIIVGPPETVQRLAAEAAAAADASKLRGNLILVSGLVLVLAVIVMLVRRRAARRRVLIDSGAGD